MDSVDRQIIGLLRSDSRMPFADIGDRVGLSASAAKRRVDKLAATGTIRGFTIEVDPVVDGLAVEAYVELYCGGTVSPSDLKRILAGIPEVIGAGTVSGDADAIVHMRARDIAALEDALERVRIAPNVTHTKSTIVLSSLIDRPRPRLDS
jgi:DNA-binding Lrp family transcriptional regulator